MNHIDLTVADLKTERTRLDEMIAALERYASTRNEAETIPVELPSPVRKKYQIKAKAGVVPGAHRVTRQSAPAETNGGQNETSASKTPSLDKLDSDKATTVAGAMKQVMLANIDKPLMSREIEAVVKEQYPDLAAKAKLETVTANLYHWESKLNVVKVGTGPLATWKINKREFFEVLVED